MQTKFNSSSQYIFKFISIQVRFVALSVTQMWCKRIWEYIVNFWIHCKNEWNPNDTMLRKQPTEISATHHHLSIVKDCNSLIRTMGLWSQAGQMVGPMTLEGETLTLTALVCKERSLSINVLWSFQSLFKLSHSTEPNLRVCNIQLSGLSLANKVPTLQIAGNN